MNEGWRRDEEKERQGQSGWEGNRQAGSERVREKVKDGGGRS